MQFPAVHWHEGLFLQPHHFQAWDRHWSERLAVGELWQNPHSYGLAELSINSSALATGFFQVDALRAKTPGGVLVEFSAGKQPERRDLRSALDEAAYSFDADRDAISARSSPTVDVFLAVPRLQLGGKNVDEAGHRNGSRYEKQWMELPDEVDAASVQPVEFRCVNAKILLSTDDPAGYDAVRIARIERGDRDGVIAQLDKTYVPPLLDCAAWPQLRSEIFSPVSDWLLQVGEHSAAEVLDAGGALHAESPIEVQRLLLLQAVNPAVTVVRMLSQSRGIHPLQAYVELARTAGSIDIFKPTRGPQLTESYDHENIGPLFQSLKQRILQSLQSLERLPYRQRTFIGNETGMQVSIEPSELKLYKRWYIGVHKGELTEEAIDELLSPGNLDWKLGSADQVDRLFIQRMPGLEMRRTRSVPAHLPKGAEWVYFELDGLDNVAWRDVERSGCLAMRFKDSLIVNRAQLPGNRKLVVQSGRTSIALQFSLFGVA